MNNLQTHRQNAGLSQSQLAAKVEGLSVRTLQHYEQGSLDINKAAVGTVAKIASVLGCSVADLLEPGWDTPDVGKIPAGAAVLIVQALGYKIDGVLALFNPDNYIL